MQGYAVLTHHHAGKTVTENTYPGPFISNYVSWLRAMSDSGWLHEIDAFGPSADDMIDILSKGHETIIATFHQS
jgi:phage terminase large subunit-like protein